MGGTEVSQGLENRRLPRTMEAVIIANVLIIGGVGIVGYLVTQ